MGNRAPPNAPQPAQVQKFWAFLHLLGAFGASFCAEMVKNAQSFRACGGQGGLRRFLIGNRSYTLHATFAARVWSVAQGTTHRPVARDKEKQAATECAAPFCDEKGRRVSRQLPIVSGGSYGVLRGR